MNYEDAYRIADDLEKVIAPFCVDGMTCKVGGLRRQKQDVHDIEIAAVPLSGAPRPEFGDTKVFRTQLDKAIYALEMEGRLLNGGKNGEKMKKYVVNTSHYGFETLNPFHVEFYLVTPPAQWGVELLIRTGPNSENDKFSQWCVTNRANGGALPDGYKQRHLAIWNVDQLDSKLEPRRDESPLLMPGEEDFLRFLGLPWIEPPARHARWRR